MSLIFLAMGACLTGAGEAGAAAREVPVSVTLTYPDGCDPTEGFPHRYVVTHDGVEHDPVPVVSPTEPFTVSVRPGSTLVVMTAVCRADDAACCTVTTEHAFASDREPPDAIVIEVPEPRDAG